MAAPYMHARLAHIEMRAEINKPHYIISAEALTEDEWEEKYGIDTSG
jgi:hypothetical protein